jgi:hypothetical protein
MSRLEMALGSTWVWLFFRIMTIPLGLMAILIGFWSPNLSHPVGLLLALFLVGVMVFGQDDLICGRADVEGIFYRRYFKQRFLPWNEVAVIAWTSRQDLQIYLKREGWFRGTLYVKSQNSIDQLPKVTVEEPEFVRWLGVVKPPAAGGIELRPPQPSTWLQNLNPLGALRLSLLVVLCVGVFALYFILRAH